MAHDEETRKQLVAMLRGGHAHATFEEAVQNFPVERAGERPPGFPHSGWELLEHLRIAQNDILRFSQSADHESPKFPDGYWPRSAGPRNSREWSESVRLFLADRGEFERMVEDPQQALHQPFGWGEGQTLYREALLIVDHNSYHLGQLVLVRRALGDWSG